MKKQYISFLPFVLAILLSSCFSTRKHYSSESHFVTAGLDKLNGKYLMNRMNLYEFFNIKAIDYEVRITNKYYGAYQTTGDIIDVISTNEISAKDTINLNFIILDFNGKDTLNIIYRDNAFWYKASYKGKF